MDCSIKNQERSNNKKISLKTSLIPQKENQNYLRLMMEKNVDKIFTGFLNEKIRRYSRYSSKGAVFAERSKKINVLKKPVFEKGHAKWINEIDEVIKKNNQRNNSSTKLTPVQASFKNEDSIYTNLTQKKMKTK